MKTGLLVLLSVALAVLLCSSSYAVPIPVPVEVLSGGQDLPIMSTESDSDGLLELQTAVVGDESGSTSLGIDVGADFIPETGPTPVWIEPNTATNVSHNPIPGTLWLFGAGLVGLMTLRKRFVRS